jgi:hypothetical protein
MAYLITLKTTRAGKRQELRPVKSTYVKVPIFFSQMDQQVTFGCSPVTALATSCSVEPLLHFT